MNILILSWRDPKHPLAGGAEQVVMEHAKGWKEAGHNITWFSSKFSGSRATEKIEGVTFVRSGYQYLGVQITAFFYYLKNRNSVDLVIDQFHGIPFFTPLYVKKPKIALIQEVAGKVWLLNPLPLPLNIFVGLIGFLVEPFIFLLYKKTQFMTGSESAKREVSRFGIPLSNITVVPHGIVLPKNKYKHNPITPPVITYLGIISKDKGVEDVIKTFSLLNSIKGCQFWVIGRPETLGYMYKIEQLVNKLKLNDKIKFWGFVTQETKFELLSKTSLLVNPSVHEGWGLVNIEANVVGTPVVSYNSAGLVDSVKNGLSGVIVEENTPEKMSENIYLILQNKPLYKKLSDGAIAWSKNFSWSQSRQRSLNLIRKVSK